MQCIDLNLISALTDSERSSIRQHCALSGLIRRMGKIRSFLIDQVHTKRADCRRGRFKPRDPMIGKLYGSVLFGGRKRVSSYDAFPLSFKSYLDDLLLRSVCRERDPTLGFSLCEVYFGAERLPLAELQAAILFEPAEWALNDPAEDRAIFFRFRDEFIESLQHLANEAQRLGLAAKKVAELRREIARYSKRSLI
jgi:hypothetical protein